MTEGKYYVYITYIQITVKETTQKKLWHKTNEPVRNFQIVYSLKQYLCIIIFLLTYRCISWTESKSSHDRIHKYIYYIGTYLFYSKLFIDSAYRLEHQTNLQIPCWDTGAELVAWYIIITCRTILRTVYNISRYRCNMLNTNNIQTRTKFGRTANTEPDENILIK